MSSSAMLAKLAPPTGPSSANSSREWHSDEQGVLLLGLMRMVKLSDREEQLLAAASRRKQQASRIISFVNHVISELLQGTD